MFRSGLLGELLLQVEGVYKGGRNLSLTLNDPFTHVYTKQKKKKMKFGLHEQLQSRNCHISNSFLFLDLSI